MTPLRHRMIEDLKLRGYSDSTQTLYVTAVRQLCAHFDKSPGKITEEELRDYFLYGKNVKKWARSTSTVALCGIKFFYENTIQRPWPTLLFIRPGHEKKLPVVLSRDEVREILSNIELLRYRACLAIDGKTMCNAIDDQGYQTHIMSAIGHQSKACYTQKK